MKIIFLSVILIIFIITSFETVCAETKELKSEIDKDIPDNIVDQFIMESIGIYFAIIISIFSLFLSIKLEWVKSKIGRLNNIHAAKIDYESNARKKLYEEARPILFQIYQSIDTAERRIERLMFSCSKGILLKHKHFENNMDDDHTIDIIVYQLLVPLVYFRLLEKKITLTDLKLDRNIEFEYELLKILFFSFAADFFVSGKTREIQKILKQLQKMFPELEEKDIVEDYSPYTKKGELQNKNAIRKYPAKYTQQGLRISQLHKVVNALIEWDDNDKSYKVISLDKFQERLNPNNSKHDKIFYDNFSPILQLFECFHPMTKPVLWRVLFLQYIIHKTLLKYYKSEKENYSITPFDLDIDLVRMDWRRQCDLKNIDIKKFNKKSQIDFAFAHFYLIRDVDQYITTSNMGSNFNDMLKIKLREMPKSDLKDDN